MTTTPDLSGFICRVHLESRWLSLEATVDIGTLPEGKGLEPAGDVDFIADLLGQIGYYARQRLGPLELTIEEPVVVVDQARRCRECGCDDENACLLENGEGCGWAEPDLCTGCVPAIDDEDDPDVDAMGHTPGEVFEPEDGEPLIDPDRLDFADELTIVRDRAAEEDDAGETPHPLDGTELEPAQVRDASEVFADLAAARAPIELAPETVEPAALAVDDLYHDGKLKVHERPAKLAELLGIPRARVAPYTRMARARGWWTS